MFRSKYFGWLAAVTIVVGAGWFLLPKGYDTLVLWLAPELGNYIRPTFVLVNALLVNPLNNITMVAIWVIAGLIGGLLAGTKKGAFVVGLMTWLTCVVILAFCIVQLVLTGLSLGTLPPLPPGESLVSLLTIPLVQSAIGSVIGMISGTGGLDLSTILIPAIIWIVTPVITAIVSAIVGAIIRQEVI